MKKAKRNYILSQIVVWTLLVLLVVSLVVCIVGVVLAESKAGTGEEHGAWIMAIVAVSVDFLAIACAVPAFRRMERALLALFDAAERADSEDSFLFGDDVLGTFGENGITMHTSHAAMDEMRAQGKKVALAQFRYINPLPANTADVLNKYAKVVVAEQNMGQLAGWLRMKVDGFCPEQYNEVKGQPFKIAELVESFTKIINK